MLPRYAMLMRHIDAATCYADIFLFSRGRFADICCCCALFLRFSACLRLPLFIVITPLMLSDTPLMFDAAPICRCCHVTFIFGQLRHAMIDAIATLRCRSPICAIVLFAALPPILICHFFFFRAIFVFRCLRATPRAFAAAMMLR